MHFLSEFHWNEKLSKDINSTFIALLPKIESPQRLNDFRPIFLVNRLYKVLANILHNVMASVISESQSAFI